MADDLLSTHDFALAAGAKISLDDDDLFPGRIDPQEDDAEAIRQREWRPNRLQLLGELNQRSHRSSLRVDSIRSSPAPRIAAVDHQRAAVGRPAGLIEVREVRS